MKRALSIFVLATLAGCNSDPLPTAADANPQTPDLAPDARLPPPDLSPPSDFAASPDATPACAGLDQTSCKARPDCIADYCQGCGCNYNYVSCRSPNAKPAVCPGLGCEQGLCCRSNADCSTPGEWCIAPGQILCGGPACMPNPSGSCAKDSDCPPNGTNNLQVCLPTPCCPGTYCAQGCVTNSDCDEAQVCTPTHRCQAKPCTTTTDCPPNFECPATQPAACTRKSCTSDADCEGFCVDGNCQSTSLGTCGFLPV